MPVAEEHQLLGRGLSHLRHQIRVGVEDVSGDEPGTHLFVRTVGERGPVTGPRLDEHVDPLVGEPADAVGDERDAPLAGRSLGRHADPHHREV